MSLDYLDFEQPIVSLDARIQALKSASETPGHVDVAAEVKRLEEKRDTWIKELCDALTPWQMVQLARHPRRPHTLDYIDAIFTDFEELHGDRMYADDAAIVGGLARLGQRSVLVMGHEKGRETEDKIHRNFGMPRPEGYRKSQRLARLAERFKLPIITLIDTPGAYPGIDAEERGQAEAIAQNLALFSTLKVPVVSVVIGEGGSGGALALGVCDYLAMLQYSTYSVISPEGCASILWKSAGQAAKAAEAMRVTAPHLLALGLIDEMIAEPIGGAHRNLERTAVSIATMLRQKLDHLTAINPDILVANRYQRLLDYEQLPI